MAVSDDDLDLTDTERILDALARRFEVFAVVAAKDKAVTDDSNVIVAIRIKHGGDRLRAMGLCALLSHHIALEVTEDFNEEVGG